MVDLSEMWIYIKNVAGVITVLGFVVEFTPIKVHPLSFICKKLGDSFNKELKIEMKEIKKDISNLNDKIKETEQKIDDSSLESKERYIKQLRGRYLASLIVVCIRFITLKMSLNTLLKHMMSMRSL